MIPGFLLAWGASGMLHGYADIFALGNAQWLVLVTIGQSFIAACRISC
jgi:hypothetical protein